MPIDLERATNSERQAYEAGLAAGKAIVPPTPGWKTSEFRLQLFDRLVIVGAVLLVAFVPEVRWQESLAVALPLAAAVIAGARYGDQRAKVKVQGEAAAPP